MRWHKKKRFILHRNAERKNTRGLCQACSKHGTRLGITWEVTACLYSTARCGSAEHGAACQPPTGQSFLCSSTITFPSHYHRNKKGEAQIRISFHSLSSLLPKQTVPANGRSTLISLLVTPFLTPTFSHIPWGDPVCILDEATDLQKQVIIKWLQ